MASSPDESPQTGSRRQFMARTSAAFASVVGGDTMLALDRSEYHIKGTFVINLLQFCNWPEDVLGPEERLIVGVLNPNPFGNQLTQRARQTRPRGRTVKVKVFFAPDTFGRCHLLFVTRMFADALPLVVEQAQARHILTVGDWPGFAQRGGMVELRVVNGKPRFDVNLSSIRSSGVRISSRVLKLAQTVHR